MKKDTHQLIHIVLVDDEPRIHEMIKAVLEEAQLSQRFDSFYEPVAFLEFIKQDGPQPDVILLDVHFNNAGLSGIDVVPLIREDYPYVPIILLTGMEEDVIEEAQNFDFVYYIPKPVSPDHLVRMVRFYLGTGRKSGRRTEALSADLAANKEQVQLLQKELAEAEIASWEGGEAAADKKRVKGFERVMEVFATVLKNSEFAGSFVQDMERLYEADFPLFKKAIETIIRVDLMDFSSPGLNIHKYKGLTDVFCLRLTKKARVFFYQNPHMQQKKLVRLDPEHDTAGLYRWLKENYDSYAG